MMASKPYRIALVFGGEQSALLTKGVIMASSSVGTKIVLDEHSDCNAYKSTLFVHVSQRL